MSENRVTTADLSSGCRQATASPNLVQWDRGQILKLTGVTLPLAYNVEFTTPSSSESTTMIGNADGVEIPDALLETGEPIVAYVVLHDTQNDRESEYWVTIVVRTRQRPEDIDPDADQMALIDQLVAALDEGVDQAEAAAAQAEAAVEKYPRVINGNWYVWNEATETWIDTEVPATGPTGVGIASVTLNDDYTLTLTFTDGDDWTSPVPIRGVQGETGATPNLSIGTVSTLEAGSPAEASISGTPENPVLNLGIPKGADGDVSSASMASTFSASTAYTKGTMVWYSGQLYEFTADHAAGAWTGSDARAVKVGEEVSSLKSALSDLDELKANKDGSYSDMTVGNAEQLVATVGVEDKVPYNFRTAGGSADTGDREVDKLVGGTLAWNQLVNKTAIGATQTINGVTFTNNGDGSITVSGTNSEAATIYFQVLGQKTWPAHKYFLGGRPKGTFSGSIGMRGQGSDVTDQNGDGAIWNAASNTYKGMVIYVGPNAAITTPVTYKPQLIDLTQLFGSTIANYIYSLETANAGAGAAWFRKLFPKDYYVYDAGSLQSVQVKSHEMVGFNAWDEEWELGGYYTSTGLPWTTSDRIRSKNYIHVLPNTKYYFRADRNFYNTNFLFYDENKNFVGVIAGKESNSSFTTPSNVAYMMIGFGTAYGTTYGHDICINLHRDGERDGEYEPYVKYSYPLDDSLTLRGIPKLDSNNNLYYVGDIYASDGTVTRKYAVLDLGTLPWAVENANTGQFNISNVNTNVSPAMKFHGNLMCVKYLNNPDGSYNNLTDGQISATNAQANVILRVVNSLYAGATAADFKAAMSGVYLVYEVYRPTTETADPYQNPQIVDDFGTEEYVDAAVTASTPTRDVAIPVGHETLYPQNLRKKIEGLPWNLSMIAPVEKTYTATQAYTAGQYLIVNNTLYKVTSNISNGGTITPGTNATATTVMAELITLTA